MLIGSRASQPKADPPRSAGTFGLPPHSLADYWVTSVVAGVRGLPGGFRRESAARIVNPLSYPRIVEFQLVANQLGDLAGKTVLDLGSPKLPVLLHARSGVRTLVATDIRDYFIGPTAHLLRSSGLGHVVGRSVRLQTTDARDICFPDASFDAVYSISVLEHIPGEGDSEAMGEIARVLKPGGIASITVPFHTPGYREEWLKADVYERAFAGEPVFYQRHYDAQALSARLVKPSGLEVEEMVFFGEPGLQVEPHWNRIPMRWKLPLLWAQPFVAKKLMRRLEAHELDRACGVALKLRKPTSPWL